MRWHRLPLAQGPLLLPLPQANAAVPGDIGQIIPAVQCHEDGPCSTGTPLGHRAPERGGALVPRVCYLPRRAGNPAFYSLTHPLYQAFETTVFLWHHLSSDLLCLRRARIHGAKFARHPHMCTCMVPICIVCCKLRKTKRRPRRWR